MKRTLKPKLTVSSTGSVKGKKRGKRSIPLSEIITSVSLLGDKITKLDHDGQWRSDNCLWSQLGDELTGRLSITNTLAI
jgi:hypothetical protein